MLLIGDANKRILLENGSVSPVNTTLTANFSLLMPFMLRVLGLFS
jgi:hypothetical protein